MACYISSNNNRFYSATETAYGTVPAVTSSDRFPAVKLTVKHATDKPARKDKTGTRTFQGLPVNLRKQTTFDVRSYMTAWTGEAGQPGYAPLFQAALGSGPLVFNGGAAGPGSADRILALSGPHGLTAGQAVAFGGEIRFVTAIVDEQTVVINAAFSLTPSEGSPIGSTVTYQPATQLKSTSIFDYWSPEEAIQRILCGAAIDRMQIQINGDYHEFQFSGTAKDLIDSGSFTQGQGGLDSFPAEPTEGGFDYTIIPGHLGQVWMGSAPDRFFTITDGTVTLNNDLDMRAREFGATTPRCFAAGTRSVTLDMDLFGREDDATKSLYQAARQRSPIEVMLQLGQDTGQLFGMYLKSVIPETPEFDDSETRLLWKFRGCRAQGTVDDEIAVAFG